MSAMEKSLRKALESGDAGDPAFRESIYSASERALERMLEQKHVAGDVAHAQRTRLAETINRVEDEFYARQTEGGAGGDGPAQPDPELSLNHPDYAAVHSYGAQTPNGPEIGPVEDRDGDEADDFRLRPVYAGENDDPSASPVAMAVDSAGEGEVSEPVKPSRRARALEAAEKATQRSVRPTRALLVLLAAILVLVLGIYFVYAAIDGGEPTAQTDAGWIGLFDGRRLDVLAAPNGGRLDARETDGAEPSVRFTPAGESSDMEVAVGTGVVSEITGRQVMVEIVAGSPDGAARTFSVECRLGGVSVCGRKVFTTTRPSETFAFRMDVPQDARAGSIAIASVPASASESLDLFNLRITSG